MPWLLYARAGLLRTFVRAGDESFGTSHRFHTHRHSNNCLFECLVFHHPIRVQCSGSWTAFARVEVSFHHPLWKVSGDCQAVSTRIQHPQSAVQRGWNRACCGAVLGWAFAKHLDVCDPMTKPGGRQQSNLRKRSSGRCPGLPGGCPTTWSVQWKGINVFVHANDLYATTTSQFCLSK